MVRDVVAGYLPFSTVRQWYRLAIELATDFDSFVQEKIVRPGVRYEVLLVMLIGAIGAIGMYYVSLQMLAASNLDEMSFVAIGRTIRPVLIILLLWALYTILFYFAANFAGGYGHARRLVKGIAWAFVPLALANAVRSVAFWFVYRDFDIEGNMEGFGPASHYETALAASLQEPAMIMAAAILILCVLWSGYLMISAVQHAKSIPRSTSIRLVGAVYLIHIVLIIWAVWQEEVSGALLI